MEVVEVVGQPGKVLQQLLNLVPGMLVVDVLEVVAQVGGQPVLGQEQVVLGQEQVVLGQEQPVLGQEQVVLRQEQVVLRQEQPVLGQEQSLRLQSLSLQRLRLQSLRLQSLQMHLLRTLSASLLSLATLATLSPASQSHAMLAAMLSLSLSLCLSCHSVSADRASPPLSTSASSAVVLPTKHFAWPLRPCFKRTLLPWQEQAAP